MSETWQETYDRIKDSVVLLHKEMREDLPINRDDIVGELCRDGDLICKWGQMSEMATADYNVADALLDDDVYPVVYEAKQQELTKKGNKKPTKDDITSAVKQDASYREAKQFLLAAKARQGRFASAAKAFNTRSFNVKSINKTEPSDSEFHPNTLDDLKNNYRSTRG